MVDSDELYRALVDLSPDAIVIHCGGHVIFVNRAGLDLFHAPSLEAVVGRPILDFVHPEAQARMRERLQYMRDTGKSTIPIEGKFIRVDGTEFYGETAAAPFQYQGEPAILGIVRDVTERREALQALSFLAQASRILSSSLDYETTLANVARLAVPRVADWCVVDIVTEDGSLQRLATAHTDPAKEEWAREISRRYPPSLDQGAGHIIRSGECSLVPEVTDEMLQSAVRDEEHLEILRGLGVRSAMSVPLTARNRTFGVMTFLISDSRRRFGPDDLTLAEDLGRRAALAVDNARLFREAEQARAEAETQRAHLHRLFMQAPAIVAVTRGPDHTFELANQRFVELLGDRNFIGRSYHDAIPEVEGQGLFAVVDAVFQSGQPFAGNEMPVQLRRGDTEELTTGYFNFVVQPVIEADGSIGGVMMHGVEVTEQVEARQEVERLAAERQQVLGEKDEFLSAAAHDLKSPLAAIKGTTQLVARRLESGNASQPADILPYLARIEATANRMNGLVNDLLDVTRIQMDQPFELEVEPTDLVALVREVVVDYQASVHRHRLVFEADESEIVGSWDAPRLARAVGNIVANAIRFSPEGGEVTARVGRNGSHAIVSVQDQGLGIPEADLPHIFERFYRGGNVMGRISGTGIGLAGSRRIVDQHGGSIDVESQEGQGSTFTIRLPL